MSRPDDFQPVWPPVMDDFNARPEVRKARHLFRAQIVRLLDLTVQAADSPTGAETHYVSQEIAALLHNISGTAAYFGAAGFGTFAGQLEQPVRSAFTADLLRPLCARIQAELVAEDLD
ncbi:MAG: Hpt domain-containing protein [Sphingomicrobium sp.]